MHLPRHLGPARPALVPQHTRRAQPLFRSSNSRQPLADVVLVLVQRAPGFVGGGRTKGLALVDRLPQDRLALLAETVRAALPASERTEVWEFKGEEPGDAEQVDRRVGQELYEGHLDQRVSFAIFF